MATFVPETRFRRNPPIIAAPFLVFVMSFPRAPPSLLDDPPATLPGRSTLRGPILDPESRDKRYAPFEYL